MKKIFAVSLTLAVLMTLTSCSLFVTKIDPERLPLDSVKLPDKVDTEPLDDFSDMTGLPDVNSAEMGRLGENLQFYHTPDDTCVIVYNDQNAWAFDYELQKVTPLIDFDAMLAVADPTGRGAEYFGDVTLSVGCETVAEREIRIVLTVKSNTHDAEYSVSVYYVLNDEITPYERGDVRGYFKFSDTVYPGSDTSITITDIKNWAELGESQEDYEERWIYRLSKAFLELDIQTLEEIMNVEDGTLDSWKDAVISDYTIIRRNPINSYFDEVTIRFTLAEGSIGRWHSDWMDGQYEVTIYDGPGQYMSISPVNGTDTDIEPTGAEAFVTQWVSHRGGWYPIGDQVVENSGYMHHLVDFYLSLSDFQIADYEEFVEFCESTFGLENVRSYVARDEVENHGGHGGNTALCDVKLEAQSGNDYIFEVTFWADVTETVAAKYYEISVTDKGDGNYEITKVECTLDNGFGVYAWGM